MGEISKNIFREYDIRGVVNQDLNAEFAFILGLAYGELAKENSAKRIAIGRDCRLSSPEFARKLAHGINAQGLEAVLIGMGPTPMSYWSLYKKRFDGCIQVTGSHNPPNMNGFKICLGKDSLFGEAIQDLYIRCARLKNNFLSYSDSNKIKEEVVINDYISDLTSNIGPHLGRRKLKVVVDAGNGVGGLVGPSLLKNLGVEVIELYCEPDGNFPNHHPDPTLPESLKDLIAKVKETKADFGVGWDGDADRIGVIDEQGNIIYGDLLLIIYAAAVLKNFPGAAVIGDVKCSSRLFDAIKDLGGRPIMWKTGHSLVKNKLKLEKAVLAGEMSGHIFFNDRFYGFDDALYCTGRLVEIMSNSSLKLSEMLACIPKMFATPEIRLDCSDENKFKIVKEARSLFADYKIDSTDGIRISFDEGWGLVRASNTQPVLVLRFEATSEEKLEEYKKLVMDKIYAESSRIALK